ncbi:hypothetical protein ETU10_07605 [Apibacter muscae]|uniref:hypothetical protein n=1 Tax=Apibacter muscae TaxID=2509004 RepID=UPI0011ABD71F|nr:hypothetical protein [Apibacter muscae]TWP23211.1 hypothetical protein ETU10_07605 [Apibacter muscae]
MKLKYLFLYSVGIYFLISCSQNKQQEKTSIIPAEDIINISVAKKAKAKITGERMAINIGNSDSDVWTIVYTDNQGNIHSTILKKNSENLNQIGDSITIYYDDSTPQSLPIFESQYLKLAK